MTVPYTGTDIRGSSLQFRPFPKPIEAGTNQAYGTNTLTVTAALNFEGVFVQRFAAGNEFGADEGAITVFIHNLERPPTATSRSFTRAEDTSFSFQVSATDPDGPSLTYSFPSPPQHGTLIGSPPDMTFVPEPNWNGTEVFTFRATDPAGRTGDGTITVNLTPVADAPIGANTTVSTRSNQSVAVPLTATDPDGPTTLTYTVLTNPPQGTLSGTPPNLTYTPPAAFTGLVGFTWRASDGALNSPTYTVTIDVQLPTTITTTPSTLSTPEDTDLPITLTAVDTQGRVLAYSVVTGLAANTGTLSGTPPNLTYRPPTNWSGSAAFRYKACVGAECSDPAQVSITTLAVNDAPTAEAKSGNTNEDTPVTIGLGGSDVESSPLSYEIAAPPLRGNAVISGNSVTYTPSTNFAGTDTFAYLAFDGAARSAPVTVTVVVAPVNDPPVAVPRSAVAYSNVDAAITLQATDPDDPAASLQYSLVTPPTHGTLTGTPPDVTYRPDTGYLGLDTFTFDAADPSGARSTAATVTIQVGGGGQAPVATPQTLEFDEDSTPTITLTGTDPEGAPLSFEIVSEPTLGQLYGTGNTREFTPRLNVTGTDAFTFRVSDGATWSAPVTVSLTIRPVNDAPLVLGPGYVTVTEDEPREIAINVYDIDSPSPFVTIVRAPTKGRIAPANTGVNRYLYTPQPNATGPDTLVVRATDGSLNSLDYTITLALTPVDDPPIASPQTRTTTEDAPLTLTLAGTDVDGDALTYRIATPPAHGTLNGTPPTLTFAPAPDFNGRDTFTFVAADGTSDSPPATVTIDISPVNDRPVVATRTVTTPEDTPLELDRVSGNLAATDAEDDALTFQFETPSTGTIERLPIGLFRFVPPADYNGRVTVVVRANDGLLTSEPATLTIDVTPVNDAPVFVAPLPPAQRSLKDGETLDFTLVARDADGDTVRFSATGLPTGATLGATSGRFQWTPTYEQVGVFPVVLRVSDNAQAFTERTFDLTVTVADTDGDRVPDAIERRFGTRPDLTDSDGDGLDDFLELGSFISPFDSDRDGTFDALDSDSDADGVLDTNERGIDGREVDTDRDGTPDQRDSECDEDGVPDLTDNCRIVQNARQADLDRDGTGDDCDPDRDGDGVTNAREIGFGTDPDLVDSDGDSIRDDHELGDDGRDTDRDGTPDAREADSDNDGVPDPVEAGDADVTTPPVDSDADGTPDYRDLDSDNDGVPDARDLCRLVTDPQQGDLDKDGEGDSCDGDEDGDGVPDRADTCPRLADPQQFDADDDGVGDACSADDDADGHLDEADNCPTISNADQLDGDADGLGDLCDETDDSAPVGGCAGAGLAGWWVVGGVVIQRRRGRGRH